MTEPKIWEAGHPTQTATVEQHELHTWATPTEVTDRCLDCRAKRLSSRAHGGSYATWLSIGMPDRIGSKSWHRVGAKGLGTLFPDAALRNIVLNVGGPVYVKRSSRGRIPCLYLRARFGGDFRELALAVNNLVKANGGWATVLDATEPAQVVITRGIGR